MLFLGSSQLTIAKSMSNLSSGNHSNSNLIHKNNSQINERPPILPSTSLHSFQTITKNSAPSNTVLNSCTALNANASKTNHTNHTDIEYSGKKILH